MKSYQVIFILGIVLILLPLIGIYSTWKEVVVFAIGIYMASFALGQWRKLKQEAIMLNKQM
jgi:hypothetical protein